MDWKNIVIILSLTLSILFIIIIFLYKHYKKNEIKILTIRKSSYFAVLLSISVILNYVSISLGAPGLSPEVSFDYIPIIIAGFLFGPLEAMLFGIMADSIILLINGWPWQIFMALQKPIIGLIGALGSYFYKNDLFKKNTVVQSIFMQSTLFIVLLTTIICLFTVKGVDRIPTNNPLFLWTFFSLAIISFILSQILFWYIKIKDNKKIHFFILSFFMIMSSRIINSWFLTSISQEVFYGIPFEVSFLLRIFTTSVAGPLNALILYWILKDLIPIMSNSITYNKTW